MIQFYQTSENLRAKDYTERNQKNAYAVIYIKLSLLDEKTLQFAAEKNAKIIWGKN